MDDKYSEGYFEHWLAMLSTMDTEFSQKGFEEQIKHYVNFEGEEEMRQLKSEVAEIVEAGDLIKFKEVGKRFNIKEIDTHSLKVMAELILNWD